MPAESPIAVGSQEFIVYLSICDFVRLFSENVCDKLQWRHVFVEFETQDKIDISDPFPSAFLQNAQLSGKVARSSSNGKQW